MRESCLPSAQTKKKKKGALHVPHQLLLARNCFIGTKVLASTHAGIHDKSTICPVTFVSSSGLVGRYLECGVLLYCFRTGTVPRLVWTQDHNIDLVFIEIIAHLAKGKLKTQITNIAGPGLPSIGND